MINAPSAHGSAALPMLGRQEPLARKSDRCNSGEGKRRAVRGPTVVGANQNSPYRAELPRLLTIEESAEILGCCERTMRNFIRAGALKVFRPSRKCVRVHSSSLIAFIEDYSSGGCDAA